MLLNHTLYGDSSSNAICIIHGLFGSSQNWTSIAKSLSSDYFVICVDCRNHGHSNHSPSMSYTDMSNDIIELLNHLSISQCILIGHSMGGKIAMLTTLNHSDIVTKQIIVDIAPKAYPPHHQAIIQAMKDIDLSQLKTRMDVSNSLEPIIPNLALRQFLVKNIATKPSLHWAINLSSISDNYSHIMDWPTQSNTVQTPTLIMSGSNSDYVNETDHSNIKQLFANTVFKSVNASHWIHAECPADFLTITRDFITSNTNN